LYNFVNQYLNLKLNDYIRQVIVQSILDSQAMKYLLLRTRAHYIYKNVP